MGFNFEVNKLFRMNVIVYIASVSYRLHSLGTFFKTKDLTKGVIFKSPPTRRSLEVTPATQAI